MSNLPIVFDASALLALFHKEPGGDVVRQALRSQMVYMSSVNYAEVAIKHISKGKSVAILPNLMRRFGISVIDFSSEDALAVGAMKPKTREWGLSLADCACLVLSKRLGAVAMTADSVWMNLKDEYNIESIR